MSATCNIQRKQYVVSSWNTSGAVKLQSGTEAGWKTDTRKQTLTSVSGCSYREWQFDGYYFVFTGSTKGFLAFPCVPNIRKLIRKKELISGVYTVSYTHLDVYKRQCVG